MNIKPVESHGTVSGERVAVSRLAGAWYEADAECLAHQIDADLQSVGPRMPEAVKALVLPHAGYRYSGRIAAQGVASLAQRRFKRIIILGTSHRIALPHQAALPDFDAMETPLGRIGLDHAALNQLAHCPGFCVCPSAFEGEHSVEIQLPVLQRACGSFTLVPLVIGQLNADDAGIIARAFLKIVDQQTLLVVSSDFTHYGDAFGFRPFGEPVPENIRDLDDGAFARMTPGNAAGFLDYCSRTGATICGRAPIAVLLSMLPNDATVHRIAYATSGEMTGDFSHCVSYLSAACALPSGWPCKEAGSPGTGLTEVEKTVLLELARNAIDFTLAHDRRPELDELTFMPTDALLEKRGAFVSLYRPHHCLRGCIGEIMPRRALCEAVIANAIHAAFDDPRFPPLDAQEWPDIKIEISALTPPGPAPNLDEIEIGKHGIVLQKGSATAVFLPQVAVEQKWTLEETLSNLALKAGLPPQAWKSGAVFTVFEAEVFKT